jgi:hypothetical protein
MLKPITITMILFCLFSCSKDENTEDSPFTNTGRVFQVTLNDRRGNSDDAGMVGDQGIDIQGYFSNILGGLHGTATITCDEAGIYGYMITQPVYGITELRLPVAEETDGYLYYNTDSVITELHSKTIYYDTCKTAGSKRAIYYSQGSYSDYSFEIKVRYISSD